MNKTRYYILKIHPKEWLFSPFLLALVMAVVIILFIPKQHPFELIQTSQFKEEKMGGFVNYMDLDSDGTSEYLISFTNRTDQKALKITTQNGNIIDQYNFPGQEIPRLASACYFSMDYDHDGYLELLVPWWRNDSIFYECFSPLDPDGLNRHTIFIDKIGDYHPERDFSTDLFGGFDVDDDGIDEAIIQVIAGFSLQPRKLYLYNFKKKTLIKSPASGVYASPLSIYDLNKDGRHEFFIGTSTMGNNSRKSTIPYHDSSSYAMVLNDQLEFLFEPVEFPIYRSKTITSPIHYQGQDLIMAVFSDYRPEQPKPSFIKLINEAGDLVYETPITGLAATADVDIFQLEKHPEHPFYIKTNFDSIFRLKADFSVEFIAKIPNFYYLTQYDLDQDGEKELIYNADAQQILTVVEPDFKTVTTASLPFVNDIRSTTGIKRNGAAPPEIFLQNGPLCMTFTYTPNPWYPFRFLVHIAIFGGLWLLLILLKRLYRFQLVQQQRIQNELIKLQYQAVSYQLDPHFILNAMNTVSSAIIKEQKEEAYQLAAKFSTLFRETLEHSDDVSRSLEVELEFVKNYLLLEQKRFDDSFSFEFIVEDEVEPDLPIPKMLIQNFVENAVKHGLRPLDKKGELVIHVSQKNDTLKISITDNGIGRKNAWSNGSQGTGKGLKLMQEIAGLYKKLEGTTIDYKIIDLTDAAGKASGTQVAIMISPDGGVK
ncbi:MAG: histidine kinase [Bacteroidetes bacterium]|jgi:hypothetical protein|nr:histidine kinase [Bacteroidota bacterium]